MSVFGFAIKKASTFAASAVRKSAPILPGFSGASATKIKGFSVLNLKLPKSFSFAFAIAQIPSVLPR